MILLSVMIKLYWTYDMNLNGDKVHSGFSEAGFIAARLWWRPSSPCWQIFLSDRIPQDPVMPIRCQVSEEAALEDDSKVGGWVSWGPKQNQNEHYTTRVQNDTDTRQTKYEFMEQQDWARSKALCCNMPSL